MVSTDALKKELEQKGFNRVFVWSRGVDTTLFQPGPPIDRSTCGRIFTYVGRVAPEKNIEAFLTIALPGRKVVIGDGPALPSLRSRYPDVAFTGFKQGRELAQLIAASSVFVFPSLTDTYGIVQLEAMACGVPVAAYPVDGPRAVIRNGCNGWMADDLAVAVSNCLDIDRNQCRRFALEHSWQASTRQFLANLCCQQHSFPTCPAVLQEAA
jgi:glycosyltransferase involved in cell wall biosynthesis